MEPEAKEMKDALENGIYEVSSKIFNECLQKGGQVRVESFQVLAEHLRANMSKCSCLEYKLIYQQLISLHEAAAFISASIASGQVSEKDGGLRDILERIVKKTQEFEIYAKTQLSNHLEAEDRVQQIVDNTDPTEAYKKLCEFMETPFGDEYVSSRKLVQAMAQIFRNSKSHLLEDAQHKYQEQINEIESLYDSAILIAAMSGEKRPYPISSIMSKIVNKFETLEKNVSG